MIKKGKKRKFLNVGLIGGHNKNLLNEGVSRVALVQFPFASFFEICRETS
jgi:hypothetical protein